MRNKEPQDYEVADALTRIITFSQMEAASQHVNLVRPEEILFVAMSLIDRAYKRLKSKVKDTDETTINIIQFTCMQVLDHYPAAQSSSGELRMLSMIYLERASSEIERALQKLMGINYAS